MDVVILLSLLTGFQLVIIGLLRVVDRLCPSLCSCCGVWCCLIVVNKKASNMDIDPGARPRSTSVRLIVETVSLGNWIWVGGPALSVPLPRRPSPSSRAADAVRTSARPPRGGAASFSFALSSLAAGRSGFHSSLSVAGNGMRNRHLTAFDLF